MEVFNFTADDLTTESNKVKELLLQELERQGLLRVPASKVCSEWAIVVHKPSWFGQVISKAIGGANEYKFSIVKLISLSDPEKRKTEGQLVLMNKENP